MKPRSTIIYGVSGEGKTSQLYFIAKYLKKTRPNKKVRLISGDGGGYNPFQDDPEMIKSGFVEALDISAAKNPLSLIRTLMQGYWPNSKGQIAPSEEFRKGLNDVCAYLVEGTSSISQLWLNNMSSTPGGVGFKLGTDYEEEGYTFGTLQQGHYGIAQQELYKVIVHGFETLPVEHVIFTGLVDEGLDSQKRSKVYGPKAAGDAMTGHITSWFSNAFHIGEVAAKNTEGQDITVKVAWFQNHLDKENGLTYLAKVSMIPSEFAEFRKLYPNGFIQLGLTKGLDKFFEFVENRNGKGQIVNANAK